MFNGSICVFLGGSVLPQGGRTVLLGLTAKGSHPIVSGRSGPSPNVH